MITPDYCRQMARYNAWQNKGLRKLVPSLPMEELTKDRGAFFGSILGTLNHLLWADMLWLKRLGVHVVPHESKARGVDVTRTGDEWAAARFKADGAITLWADRIRAIDLAGQISWTNSSGEANSDKAWICVTHFFNHQTHHRGQVHAMLTAAGQTLPDTDLIYLLE